VKFWFSIAEMCRELGVRKDLLVTIGNFDGVHRGHRLLLQRLKEKAQENGGFSLAVTFREHPDGFLRQDAPLLLTTVEERAAIFSGLGLDGCLVLDFNKELASMAPVTFLSMVKGWGARGFIVGYDFRFGAGAAGGTGEVLEFCRSHGLLGEVIPPVKVGGEIVSSSRIRELLLAGELAKANRMLGRPYLITGRVIHGAHRGRLLGFPTANLELPANRLLPGSGVYLVRSFFAGETRFGLANIGLRPTFARSQPAAGSQTVAESESKAENQRTTEIYLLDTSADLYGKTMTLEFLAFIREERRFPSTAALVAQMKKDEATARRLLRRHSLFPKQTLSG
jgi:riboflavin kinase/FMN adenylyltransferase